MKKNAQLAKISKNWMFGVVALTLVLRSVAFASCSLGTWVSASGTSYCGKSTSAACTTTSWSPDNGYCVDSQIGVFSCAEKPTYGTVTIGYGTCNGLGGCFTLGGDKEGPIPEGPYNTDTTSYCGNGG